MCPIEQYFYELQCFKCQRLRHTSAGCKSERPRCRYRAKGHDSRECTDLFSLLTCCNCFAMKCEYNNHDALDVGNCAVAQRAIFRTSFEKPPTSEAQKTDCISAGPPSKRSRNTFKTYFIRSLNCTTHKRV